MHPVDRLTRSVVFLIIYFSVLYFCIKWTAENKQLREYVRDFIHQIKK